MYITAQLVVKSYKPHALEKGMWFVRQLPSGDKEIFELDKTFLDMMEEQQFLTENGYPVEPYIIEEYLDGSTPAILAEPEQIAWFDEGEDTDELRDIRIIDINYIIQYTNGFLMIDIDEETGEPTIYEDKVILTDLMEEYEDYDEDLQWDYMNGEYPDEE